MILHYCIPTAHCGGGRNDCSDWSRVDCPNCLKSKPAPVTARELADLLALDKRLDAADLARREAPDALKHLIYDWIDARWLLDSAERRIREAANMEPK